MRGKYDRNPKSLAGRVWRWHINFCPGWKNYFTHQDEETKAALADVAADYDDFMDVQTFDSGDDLYLICATLD